MPKRIKNEPIEDLVPLFLNEERGEYQTERVYWRHPESHVSLYRCDALRTLGQLRASFFDLIFADPPYFLSNDGITCQAGKMVSVNKGTWDKSSSFEEMHAFNLQWLQECRRILKPNGTIWISGT